MHGSATAAYGPIVARAADPWLLVSVAARSRRCGSLGRVPRLPAPNIVPADRQDPHGAWKRGQPGFRRVSERELACPDRVARYRRGGRAGREGEISGWRQRHPAEDPFAFGTNSSTGTPRARPSHGCRTAQARRRREPCCASARGPRTIDSVIPPPTGRAAVSAPGSAPGVGRALLVRGHAGARKVP